MQKESISPLQLVLFSIVSILCGALAQFPMRIGVFSNTGDDIGTVLLNVMTTPNFFLAGIVIQMVVILAESLFHKKISAKKYFQDRVRGFVRLFDFKANVAEKLTGDFTLIALVSFPVAAFVSLLINKPYPVAFYLVAGTLPAFYSFAALLACKDKKKAE